MQDPMQWNEGMRGLVRWDVLGTRIVVRLECQDLGSISG